MQSDAHQQATAAPPENAFVPYYGEQRGWGGEHKATPLAEDVWFAYTRVRTILVLHYFGVAFAVSVIVSLLLAFVYGLLVPSAGFWAALQLGAVALIVIGLLVPSLRLALGGLVAWSQIRFCNSILDKEVQRQEKLRQGMGAQTGTSELSPQQMLDKLAEVAITNAGADWGATQVLGLFTSIFAAVLAFHYQAHILTPILEAYTWGATLALYFAFLVSALGANADTLIRQTVYLRSIALPPAPSR